MTKFNTDGSNMNIEPITSYKLNLPKSEDKYPKARALAAAFWASYFALHWLLILEVVETTPQRSGTSLFFFVFAVLLTLLIDARDDPKVKK